MSDHDDVSEVVEIDFEVGHSSVIRAEPTTLHNPPRTHDWIVFLRSADIHGDLSCLIHRCVFHLHPEFPNSKRELKTTPFAIQETGYAGFHLPIDIHFKTKTEPKKFRIEYDLDLHKNIDGHPFRRKESYLQKYRCTFHDPDPEFRQKILAAGGKIVDSGPIASNSADLNENGKDEGTVVRHSPAQKRAASPVPLADGILHKKLKLDPTIKKKQVPTIVKHENVNKTIGNKKKVKLVPCKSSSVLEGNVSQKVPVKESNPTKSVNSNIENSSVTKPRTSTKLIKSQSTNDIKSSLSSTMVNSKKKESISSPLKTKSTINPPTVLKKTINKIPPKTSIKTEPTSSLAVKSPLNVLLKLESPPPPPPPQPTSTIISSTPSVSINNLKKIPKKPVSSKVEEKRSHSLMPSSSLARKSTISKDTQKQQGSSSTTKSKLKRDHSLTSVNTSSKIQTVKDQSNRSRNEQSKPAPSKTSRSRSPSQSRIELSTSTLLPSSVDTSRPSMPTPSASHVFQNEDNHIQTPMDIDRQNDNQLQLSDESNSPHEQVLIQPAQVILNRISYSDQSDTHDNDRSIEDGYDDEEDLPSSLTNDELRYKLIYIYQRFQSNSNNDLIIFVRFFKRHLLIDISTLSMTKCKSDMFTYDLLSLSPSHISELANDLGYTPMETINSIE